MRSLFSYSKLLNLITVVITTSHDTTSLLNDIQNISKDEYCNILDNNVKETNLSMEAVEIFGRFVWQTLISNKSFILILKNNNLLKNFNIRKQHLQKVYLIKIKKKFSTNDIPNTTSKLSKAESTFIDQMINMTLENFRSLNLCHKKSISKSLFQKDDIRKIINKNLCLKYDDSDKIPSVYYRKCDKLLEHYRKCQRKNIKNFNKTLQENKEFLSSDKCIDINFYSDKMRVTTNNSSIVIIYDSKSDVSSNSIKTPFTVKKISNMTTPTERNIVITTVANDLDNISGAKDQDIMIHTTSSSEINAYDVMKPTTNDTYEMIGSTNSSGIMMSKTNNTTTFNTTELAKDLEGFAAIFKSPIYNTTTNIPNIKNADIITSVPEDISTSDSPEIITITNIPNIKNADIITSVPEDISTSDSPNYLTTTTYIPSINNTAAITEIPDDISIYNGSKVVETMNISSIDNENTIANSPAVIPSSKSPEIVTTTKILTFNNAATKSNVAEVVSTPNSYKHVTTNEYSTTNINTPSNNFDTNDIDIISQTTNSSYATSGNIATIGSTFNTITDRISIMTTTINSPTIMTFINNNMPTNSSTSENTFNNLKNNTGYNYSDSFSKDANVSDTINFNKPSEVMITTTNSPIAMATEYSTDNSDLKSISNFSEEMQPIITSTDTYNTTNAYTTINHDIMNTTTLDDVPFNISQFFHLDTMSKELSYNIYCGLIISLLIILIIVLAASMACVVRKFSNKNYKLVKQKEKEMIKYNV
ncbi:putative SP-containing membrane protein [Vairimorpha necatrix]|uniref:SP-containing membrane protein n=1 Tax=Vairimorpha necatrix TaxID=6039 RepID=A0AAX4JCQ0_9MICR